MTNLANQLLNVTKPLPLPGPRRQFFLICHMLLGFLSSGGLGWFLVFEWTAFIGDKVLCCKFHVLPEIGTWGIGPVEVPEFSLHFRRRQRIELLQQLRGSLARLQVVLVPEFDMPHTLFLLDQSCWHLKKCWLEEGFFGRYNSVRPLEDGRYWNY